MNFTSARHCRTRHSLRRRSVIATTAAVAVAVTGLAMPAAHAITGEYAEFPVDPAAAAPTVIANLGGDAGMWLSLSGVGKLATVATDGKVTTISPSQMAPDAAPAGLALGGDKRIWIAESKGNRIGAYTPSNSQYAAYPLPTAASTPTELATAADGSVWFTEFTGDRIGRIDSTGKITEFTLAAGTGPSDIELGSDGAMWFTARSGNAIGRITPGGVLTMVTLPHAASAPDSLSLGADGNIWFTESTGNRIGRITPGSIITEFDLPVTASAPAGITALPDGNMWFTEGGATRIGRITPTGTIVEYAGPQSARGLGIAAGPDGNAWFTQPTAGRIARVLTGVIPVAGAVPVITPSSAAVGATLTSSTGTWSFAPTSYAYRWQRCTTATTPVCTDISGAAKSTYVPVAADAGQRVQVIVSAANLNGTAAKSVTSGAVSVTAAPAPAPAPTPTKPLAVTGGRSVQIGADVAATILSASSARRGRYQTFTLQMSNPAVQGRVRMSILSPTGQTIMTIASGKWITTAGVASKARRMPTRIARGYYTLQMVYTPIAAQQYLYSTATMSIPFRLR